MHEIRFIDQADVENQLFFAVVFEWHGKCDSEFKADGE